MLLCPKCNKKYEEGFTVCAVCGRDLVEYQPLVDEEELKKAAELLGEEEAPGVFEPEEAQLEENNAPALLISVADQLEATRIMSLLEDASIPCLKRTEGAGQISELLTGASFTSYDIYVPGALLRKALELINTKVVDEQGEAVLPGEEELEDVYLAEDDSEREMETEQEPDEESLDRSARRITWITLTVVALAAIAGIVIALVHYFGS